MAPPSALAIASGAVVRLRKEEVSYRTELAEQEAHAKALEDKTKRGGHGGEEDGNEEFMLKQQQIAIEQTKAVFEPLRKRITEAIARLEEQIESSQGKGDVSAADLEQARAVLKEAKTA
ncbi:tubulin binding cofactor A domain-containing protein [Hirsutella rhossiliensis]|uniref:Tubulin-specific chaperone A n=1 Tax=Hirsutella rhossiliensis TaxID=111463 RepID=A0A9P8SFN8_9HYPO|nr:tubulin binding cofactor A domain-containing protein [Hirsutella rhossiliensis]KAH0960946.1 tubulin binding cofactor A domain-containing protein [Hirsutella rhossiliensis]